MRSGMGVTVLALGLGAELSELLAGALGTAGELQIAELGDERWHHALQSRQLDVLVTTESFSRSDAALGIADLRRAIPSAALFLIAEDAAAEHLVEPHAADGWASASVPPVELGALIGRAIAERRDRFRWPRSFAERRVLTVAPATSDPARVAVLALEGAGYDVTSVADSAAAMAVLRHGEVQVVLVDVTEDVDGGEALVRAIAGFDGRVACVAMVEGQRQVGGLLRAGALTAVLGWPTSHELLALIDGGWHAWAAGAPVPTFVRCWRDEPLRVLLRLPAIDDGSVREVLAAQRPAWTVSTASDLTASDLDGLRAALQDDQHDLLLLDEEGWVGTGDCLVALRAIASRPAVVVLASGGDDSLVSRRLADGVVDDRLAAVDPQRWLLLLDAALGRAAVERRGAVLAQRLHEVDARRVELIRKLADVHLELERMATVDPVTEVLNRRGIQAALSRELEAARRSGGNVTACYVDCDDFRRVNERCGHGVGDLVLRAVAERLNSALRRTDSIGRVGGDEFLMVLPQTRIAEALLVAERARVAVSSQAFGLAEDLVSVSVSMGVAVLPWDARTLDEVLPLTRLALEQSKRCVGGEGVVGATGDSLAAAIEQLTGELVSGEGLRALVQPIVRVSDEQVVGHELLTRAREGLFEEPAQFLGVARDRGVLTAVDLQCLKVCMKQAQALAPDLQVHVNLFPSTLLDIPTEQLVELLQLEDGVQLCVELSEEQFVGDPRELLERLAALRSSGLRLAIDDVGKGRGTLDSVMLLEPDVVKIDQELISGAYRDVRKERLLRRLVMLAGALNCEVVGEGVENPEDLALLRELDVPYAQGYLWSRPREVEPID